MESVDAIVAELKAKLDELVAQAEATAVNVLTEAGEWIDEKLAELEA